MVDKLNENRILSFQRDFRNASRTRMTARNMALLYGHRPMDHRGLKYLSPYEFTMHWEPQLLKYPTTLEENSSDTCQAKLTAAGRNKLQQAPAMDLLPGIDYVVKDEGGENWIPLEDVPAMATLRHDWILQRRRRPVAPHFKGCRIPRHAPGCGERNAKLTMTYFHPWTLREDCCISDGRFVYSNAGAMNVLHLSYDFYMLCKTNMALVASLLVATVAPPQQECQ